MTSVFLGLTLMSLPFLISTEIKILRENKEDFYFIFLGLLIVVVLVIFRGSQNSLGTLT